MTPSEETTKTAKAVYNYVMSEKRRFFIEARKPEFVIIDHNTLDILKSYYLEVNSPLNLYSYELCGIKMAITISDKHFIKLV